MQWLLRQKGNFVELWWWHCFQGSNEAVEQSGTVFLWLKRLICFERPCAEGRACTVVSIMQCCIVISTGSWLSFLPSLRGQCFVFCLHVQSVCLHVFPVLHNPITNQQGQYITMFILNLPRNSLNISLFLPLHFSWGTSVSLFTEIACNSTFELRWYSNLW